jgi:hypothetical protein
MARKRAVACLCTPNNSQTAAALCGRSMVAANLKSRVGHGGECSGCSSSNVFFGSIKLSGPWRRAAHAEAAR